MSYFRDDLSASAWDYSSCVRAYALFLEERLECFRVLKYDVETEGPVDLKTLIVIHRALKEVDPTFHEELINYVRSRTHLLNMSYFRDDLSASAWDYSSCVRAYVLFLEERLECFRVLKYDVETEGPDLTIFYSATEKKMVSKEFKVQIGPNNLVNTNKTLKWVMKGSKSIDRCNPP